MENFYEREHRQAFLARLFRKIFLDDWTMKLIALVITLGLWLGITGLRTPITRRITGVPLNLRVANDLEVTNSPVAEITLTIAGDKAKIDQINQRDLIASLDLSEIPAGDRVVPVAPENISIELPAGVKLEAVAPSTIPVKLEKIVERDVPVKAVTEGDLTEGFEIYSSQPAPVSVRVSGPESFVRPLDSVSTERINIENRQEDFTARQVSLNVVNPKVRLIDRTVVDVIFRIGEERIEKTFNPLLKTEKGERRIPVRLYAPRSIIENLRPEDVKIELVRTDSSEFPKVILPSGLEEKVEIREIKF